MITYLSPLSQAKMSNSSFSTLIAHVGFSDASCLSPRETPNNRTTTNRNTNYSARCNTFSTRTSLSLRQIQTTLARCCLSSPGVPCSVSQKNVCSVTMLKLYRCWLQCCERSTASSLSGAGVCCGCRPGPTRVMTRTGRVVSHQSASSCLCCELSSWSLVSRHVLLRHVSWVLGDLNSAFVTLAVVGASQQGRLPLNQGTAHVELPLSSELSG